MPHASQYASVSTGASNQSYTRFICYTALAAVVSAVLAFGMAAQAGEPKGETVDMKTLPAAVQKTITKKAAGGEIVQVGREDDKNGKWNYEVVVKTDGKEWGFEVDPNGKYVKKHADHTKTE